MPASKTPGARSPTAKDASPRKVSGPARKTSASVAKNGKARPESSPPNAMRTTGRATSRAGSAPEGGHGSSLVKQAVDALRKRILAVAGGEVFLGSEEQLIEALGVSRPTFRQAARLLEHELLLKIKRGIHGGFFAQPPSASAVSRMAAIYLNAQGTTLQQISAATSPVVEEAAALLALAKDPSVCERLAEYQRRHVGFEESGDERHRVRVLLEFETLVGDLCGNPAVALVLNMMRDLVRDPRHGHFQVTNDMARVHADFHEQLVGAVLRKDADMARLLTRRHITRISVWLPATPISAD